jgi:hypothetical protein
MDHGNSTEIVPQGLKAIELARLLSGLKRLRKKSPPGRREIPVRQAQGRLSGAKALMAVAFYGTAKAVP